MENVDIQGYFRITERCVREKKHPSSATIKVNSIKRDAEENVKRPENKVKKKKYFFSQGGKNKQNYKADLRVTFFLEKLWKIVISLQQIEELKISLRRHQKKQHNKIIDLPVFSFQVSLSVMLFDNE